MKGEERETLMYERNNNHQPINWLPLLPPNQGRGPAADACDLIWNLTGKSFGL